MGRAYSIVALIFGIISILVGIFIAWADIFGVVYFMLIVRFLSLLEWAIIGVAIVFGIFGIIVDKPKGLAIAGLILGIIGLIIRITFRFLSIIILGMVP
ncbi:MAG: hypothetical protein ACFFBH_16255 [Promethearchaeota archaeon]